jgi:hypothetical protein
MLQSGAFDVDCENPVVKDRLTVIDAGLSIGFTMELAMRTATATSAKQMCHSVFWWIDVVAVVPFYLDLVATAAAGDPYLAGGKPQSEDEAQPEPQDRTLEDVQDLLSLLRVVRVLKVIRHHPDSKLLYDALRMSARPLLVPLTFLIVGELLCHRLHPAAAQRARSSGRSPPDAVSFFFGAAVYYFEKLETGATDKFPDIGTSIWFMLVTFSTVGYGDYAPVTHSGRAITSLAIIAGVIFMSSIPIWSPNPRLADCHSTCCSRVRGPNRDSAAQHRGVQFLQGLGGEADQRCRAEDPRAHDRSDADGARRAQAL